MTRDVLFFDLARRQHGVVSTGQARDLGYPDSTIAQRVRSGWIERVCRRVLRVPGSAETDEQQCMIAVLTVSDDAVVSHETAAYLWGLPGFRLTPVHVTRRRPSRGRPRSRRTVHQPRRLLEENITQVDGVPVTNVAQLLFDLASTPWVSPKRIERALDTAWSRSLVGPRSLDHTLRRVARRGRAGSTLMRELLLARGGDYRPPESGLEARFQEIARRHGYTELERQVDIGDDDEWLGRVDFRWATMRMAVFVDSERYHSSLIDTGRDEEQTERLESAGWTVVRVSDLQCFHRPIEIVRALREGRARAQQRQLVMVSTFST